LFQKTYFSGYSTAGRNEYNKTNEQNFFHIELTLKHSCYVLFLTNKIEQYLFRLIK
jgi:hypothetical protein